MRTLVSVSDKMTHLSDLFANQGERKKTFLYYILEYSFALHYKKLLFYYNEI